MPTEYCSYDEFEKNLLDYIAPIIDLENRNTGPGNYYIILYTARPFPFSLAAIVV